MSQRRLTIGICINVVAIAFEVIAVATAMPVAARDLNGLTYYAWSFSLFVIGMLFAGRRGPAERPAGPGPAPGHRDGDLRRRAAAGRVRAPHAAARRRPAGPGPGQRPDEHRGVRAGRPGLLDHPTAAIFTFISTAWILPSFVGPPVSAWLTEQLSWHWVFYPVVPLVIGGGLLILPTLRRLGRSWTPGRRRRTPPRPPRCGRPVSSPSRRPRSSWPANAWTGSPSVCWSPALAGLVIGLPRLMPACFGRFGRGLPAVILSRGLLAGAFVGAEAFVPLMLVEERQVALVLAGAALTVGSVGWTAGSWLQSRPWLGSAATG